MNRELALIADSSLFRRADIQVEFIQARGMSPRGNLPDLAAKLPLGLIPRAKGSLNLVDWKFL